MKTTTAYVNYDQPLRAWARRRREKLGLSVWAVARKTGLGEYTVARFERGDGAYYPSTLAALLRLYGPPPKRVLKGLDPDSRARVLAVVRRLQEDQA